MNRRQFLTVSASSFSSGLICAKAAPWRLVVPFATGGAADMVARLIAGPLAQALGEPVQVENLPGDGGSRGMAEVARSREGRTLGLASVSTHGVNPAIYQHLPYDAQRDFRPVAALVSTPTVMAVHPSVPAQHDAFYRMAKARPGLLHYVSPGVGSLGHMLGELYRGTTGTRLVHTPFASTSQAKAEVMAGRAQVIFDNLPSSAAALAEGSLQAVAVSAPARLASLPQVPTFAELNLYINNDPSWFGLVAPSSLVRADVQRIAHAAATALQRGDTATRLRAEGMTALSADPDDFERLIGKEISKMRRVARFAGISLS